MLTMGATLDLKRALSLVEMQCSLLGISTDSTSRFPESFLSYVQISFLHLSVRLKNYGLYFGLPSGKSPHVTLVRLHTLI